MSLFIFPKQFKYNCVGIWYLCKDIKKQCLYSRWLHRFNFNKYISSSFCKITSMKARSDKAAECFGTFQTLLKFSGLKGVQIPYRTGSTPHVQFNSCSGKSKTYFCFLFAHVPPSYSSCWEGREVALLQTSKFRYVSACQRSCVLNMEICNMSSIAQSYTLFFLLKTKRGQAPGASAHKFIVLALGNLAGNSCSLNANLQSEHLLSSKRIHTTITLMATNTVSG